MEIKEPEETVKEVDNTDLTLQTMMRADLDVQISTAKAYPRSLKRFMEKALSMATLTVDIAESCNYALPRAGKVIDGPSVRLAEIVFSTYGNIRVGARVVMNDGRRVTAQGVCHDLESNVSFTIEVSRSIMQHELVLNPTTKKWVRSGKMIPMNEDLQTLAGNACCSVAFRNAVFKVVPKAMWNGIYEEALRVAKGDASTLVDRRTKAVAYFHTLNVTDAQICLAVGVERIEDIDLDKLAMLTAFKATLRNKEGSVESIFPPIVPTTSGRGAAASKATEDKLNKNKKRDGESPTA